jgi:hypothetical protein
MDLYRTFQAKFRIGQSFDEFSFWRDLALARHDAGIMNCNIQISLPAGRVSVAQGICLCRFGLDRTKPCGSHASQS